MCLTLARREVPTVLPEVWTGDPDRLCGCGVPADRVQAGSKAVRLSGVRLDGKPL